MRRGAFVDDSVHDILYAFRTFRKSPLTVVTIVGTVALGLGLVAVVFTLFNVLLLRVDAVRNPAELFAVERPRAANGQRVRLTRLDYDALRRETQVFSDTVAMVEDIDARVEGRRMEGTLVTGNFFQMLGVNAARGRALTPADEQPSAGRPVMVLSHRGWARLAASDPAVVGRTLVAGGVTYAIVGVMPESFRGLTVAPPDFWAPLSLLNQVRPVHGRREDAVDVDIVGRLRPGVSRQAALSGLAVWDAARSTASAERSSDRRGVNLTLEPRQGTLPQSGESLVLFTPLFFAFGLILMIGCANVANLLLARGIARQREIGIRLAIGASRWRIIRQLLTESLLLAFAAAALGALVSRAVLQATISAVMTTMAPELTEGVRLAVPPADWRVAVFLVVGAIVSTVFFGLMPALQATRLELVRTVRGDVTKDSRPRRARSTLIGAQVTASALLLIAAAVFLRSAMASATIDPGVRTADTVIVEISNEPMRDAVVRAVMAEPLVFATAASWPDTLGAPRAAFAEATAPKSAFADAGTGKTNVAYRLASSDYFSVLGIDLLDGRTFAPNELSGHAGVAVIAESLGRQLWPNRRAVGQVLTLEPDPNSETKRQDEPPLLSRTVTVVGIARDVPGFRIAGYTEANVYVPASAAMAKTSLTVRVHGDPELARRALLQRLTTIDSNVGQIVTMRTLANMETYFLRIAFWMTLALGGLALVLTVSGLFSVLSYLVAQRANEIGVRMALGATGRSIAALVLTQSLRPVGIGITVGAGLAAGLAVVLIATPSAAQISAVIHVLDPVAYAASLACIITACALAALIPARRAARLDPMTTLRQE